MSDKVTIEQLEIVINAKVDDVIKSLDNVLSKIKEISQPIKTSAGNGIGDSVSKYRKSANAILKEKARLEEQIKVIQSRAQQQIETVTARETAKRLAAEEKIAKFREMAASRAGQIAETAEQQTERLMAMIDKSLAKAEAVKPLPKPETAPARVIPLRETPEMRAATTAGIEKFIEDYSAKIDKATASISRIKETVDSTVPSMLGLADATGNVEKPAQGILGHLSKLVPAMAAVGKAAVPLKGIFNGVFNAIKLTARQALILSKNIAGSVVSGIKNASRRMIEFGKNAVKGTSKAKSAFLSLGETIKRVFLIGGLYKAVRAFLSFLSNGIKSAIAAPEIENLFRVAMGNMANEAAKFSTQLKNALGIDPYVTKEMLGTFQNLTTSMGIGTQTAFKMSKSMTMLANDMASLYNADPQQTFENLQSALTGQGRAVRKYGYVITEATIKESAYRNGLAKTGAELTESQKVIARYLALLEQSGNAQGDMSRTIQSLQNQLRMLKQNILAAGRSISEGFIPFIQAVAPWLNALFILLQRLGAAFARFSFGLFGKNYDTWKKQQESIVGGAGGIGDALEEMGDAAEGAGKKAKGALAPFDELNVLSKDMGADSGKTGGAGGGGLEFAVPELDYPDGESPFEKMADDIENFFKNNSPTEIGGKLADWLNDLFDKIKWAEIGKKIGKALQKLFEGALTFLKKFDTGKIGAGLATLINKIFKNLDPVTVGATIAEFFNRLTDFVHDFVDTLEWEFIGEWFGNAINSFVKNFDAYKLGDTIGDLINGINDFFYKTILTTDWSKIGTKFAHAINGLFNAVKLDNVAKTIAELINSIVKAVDTAVTKINWDKIKTQISSAINTFFDTVDWAELGKTIGKTIDKLLSTLSEIIKETNWSTIGAAIADTLNGILSYSNIPGLAKAVGNLINGIVESVRSFVERADWNKVSTEFSSAINTFFDTVDWEELGKTIDTTIKKLIKTFSDTILKTDWKSIGKSFKTLAANIDWTGIVVEMSRLLGIALGGLAQLLWGFIDDAVKSIKEYFSKKMDEAGGDVVLGFLNGISDAYANITKWIIDNIFKPFINGIKAAFGIDTSSKAKETEVIGDSVIQGFIGGVKNKENEAVEPFKKILERVKETWKDTNLWFESNVTTPLQELFNKYVQPIIESFNEAWEGVKLTWSKAKEWFDTNVIKPIQELYAGIVDPIKESFESAWAKVKEVWGNVSSWFNENVARPIKSVLNGIIGVFNGFLSGTSGAINSLVRAANKIKIDIPSWVPGVGGKKFGVNVQEITTPQIPRLATGAVIKSPTMALIGEYSGASSNPEIVAPQNIIYDTVVEANGVLATALAVFAQQIVQAIKENKPVAFIGDKDIFDANQRAKTDYSKMMGIPAF